MESASRSPRPYSSDEDALIRSDFGKIPHKELCARLGRTPHSLIPHAKIQLGLSCPSRGEMRKLSVEPDWFTEAEDEILRQHWGRSAKRHVMAMLPHRTHEAIRGRARKLGIQTIGRSKLVSLSKRRYTWNDDFFAEPNTHNSYFAGLLAADGCLRNGSLQIGLTESDRELIDAFVSAVEYTGRVAWRPQRGGIKPQVSLVIHKCPGICRDLERNYSLTPRKSLTLQPPRNLSDECAWAFIRGYIDGDGCIGVQDGRLRMSIRGTESMLTWIARYFSSVIVGVGQKGRVASVKKYQSDSTYSYSVCGERAVAICAAILHTNALPRLDRKWDIARRFL